MKLKKEWQHCPYCGDTLDVGWECNNCLADWRNNAYPWWKRIIDKITEGE